MGGKANNSSCFIFSIYYRLSNLLGYRSTDMIGHVPFEFHHHDDVNVTINCSKECNNKIHM